MEGEFSAGAHTILEEIVDVRDEDAVQRAVKIRSKSSLGSVDILICFAGMAVIARAEEMTLEEWTTVLTINTTGSWLCAKAVAKEMIRQGTGGSVVFTSSTCGHHTIFPIPQAAYGVSKAGLIALTKNLAAEWAQHGIRVNSISPGIIETRLSMKHAGASMHKAWNERTPLGRFGVPAEVAGPVVMLCSPAARFITGTDILIDGGEGVF